MKTAGKLAVFFLRESERFFLYYAACCITVLINKGDEPRKTLESKIMKKTEIQSASFQKLISAAAISMREAAESYATDILSNISNPVPAAREMLIAEKLRELLSFEQDCLQLVSSWRKR